LAWCYKGEGERKQIEKAFFLLTIVSLKIMNRHKEKKGESMKKAKKQIRMEEWLDGLSLSEKIETLEKGKLCQCIKCGKYFHDKETFRERQLRKCKPAKAEHECVEGINYIILRRGFVGILGSICYEEGEFLEDLVIDYFNRRR